jgi:lipid-A-disaccharide synthase-like uncharacterized protein
MNEVIFKIQLLHKVWAITPWKLIGYAGVLTFAGRWFVQVIASHQAGHSHLPRLFWYMSLTGSALLLSYFTFSDKKDSVGLLSNLFPASVAVFNLFLEHRRGIGARTEVASPGESTE